MNTAGTFTRIIYRHARQQKKKSKKKSQKSQSTSAPRLRCALRNQRSPPGRRPPTRSPTRSPPRRRERLSFFETDEARSASGWGRAPHGCAAAAPRHVGRSPTQGGRAAHGFAAGSFAAIKEVPQCINLFTPPSGVIVLSS